MKKAPNETSVRRILDEIEADARATAMETGREKFSKKVMNAIAAVARDRFVPDQYKDTAYINRPLPIGHGQTISQPFIVALMTDLLETGPDHRVLEIGTGSGYQAAVLSNLVREVFSIERVAELAESASLLLQELGYGNVHVRCGDGGNGWPEEAPFDGIIVTAAASVIPDALLEQLAPGGRLVIPVGERWGHQVLKLICRDSEGNLTSRSVLRVAFVPLLSGTG